MLEEQDRRLVDALEQERVRLENYVRANAVDEADAEDILAEAFEELLEAFRSVVPIERVGSWLFRVARNRIIDRFRRRKPAISLSTKAATGEPGSDLEDLLPSAEAGPEASFARKILTAELAAALDELPEEQRTAFLAHEVDGKTFAQLSAETGIGINTLLGRKHLAVLHLRERLRDIYKEFEIGRESQ